MKSSKIILKIIIIILIHYYVLNPIEKVFTEQYIVSSKRPKQENKKSVSSLGMPSGHVELATLVCMILVSKKLISIKVCFGIIILMAIQRVVSEAHTINQTIVGFITGMIYYSIYKKTEFWYIFIIILIAIILFKLIEISINKQMREIPDWVDTSLHRNIYKKQKSITKYYELLAGIVSAYDNQLYLSYDDIRTTIKSYLKQWDKKIDCVVGLKSGGAILSKLIADELNIPYYFIKIEDKKYKCNKDKHSTLIQLMNYVNNERKEYDVCEKINNDLTNLNVLLIDECIGRGIQFQTGIDYLYLEKKVNHVYPYIFLKNNKFDYLYNTPISIWAWGYDN